MSSTCRRAAYSARLARGSQAIASHQVERVEPWRPSSRFSRTVRLPKSSMFWKVRAMPLAAIRSGRCPMSDSPRRVMAPESGRYTPEMQLNADVLPAPLGPMTANSSPSWTSKDTWSRTTLPPKDSTRSLTLSNRAALTTATACGACSA